MEDKYREWIALSYPGNASIGACKSATTKMVADFPELKAVAGRVLSDTMLAQEHWWCVTQDGSVVDPTAEQFELFYGTSADRLEYIPFEPGDYVRVGRCMYCGFDINAKVDVLDKPADVFSTEFCNEDCYSDFATSLG